MVRRWTKNQKQNKDNYFNEGTIKKNKKNRKKETDSWRAYKSDELLYIHLFICKMYNRHFTLFYAEHLLVADVK